MKSILLVSLLVLVSCPAAFSQSKDIGSGIIFGKGISYVLSAPKGWVMDNESGVGSGLHAVFYPNGSSWSNGTVVMYTNVLGKADEKQTLQDVINNDIADFKKASSNLTVEDGRSIAIDKEKTAVVKVFSGEANGNYEAVAYINESKVVVVVVLTSRSKKEYDSSTSAFHELVSSYKFLTDKVIIQK